MPMSRDVLGVHPINLLVVAKKKDELDQVTLPDGDETMNWAVAEFQDGLDSWRYRSIQLSPLVANIRDWAWDLWEQFLPKEWAGTPIKQPPVLFRFQWENPRVLGH